EDRRRADPGVAADVATAADQRPLDHRIAADAAVRPQDGAGDHRVFLDHDPAAQHAVWSDPRPRLDGGPGGDEARTCENGAGLDLGLGRHHRLTRGNPGRAERAAALEDVAVHRDVLFRRADVDPVAALDVSDEGLATLDQRWEVAALDRIRRVLGN